MVKKIFHPVRTIFKGSGFYITDKRAEQSAASGAGSAKKENSSEAAQSTSQEKSDGSGEKTTAATPAPATSEAAKAESKTA